MSRHAPQPTVDTAAMCANDFNWASHASHFSALPMNPKRLLSTAVLCHATPSASGTWPNFFLVIRFTIAPSRPVISVGGTRVVLVMLMETPAARRL